MEKTKYFFKSLIGVTLFNSIIFISAGKLSYFQGWAYFLISTIGLILNVASIQNNEQLMKEREKPEGNIKTWDKVILGLSALITIIAYIIAGLDSGRFHWTHNFSLGYFFMGMILVILGQVIFLVAKKQNEFFSSVARIQTERNHAVCNDGLYKLVRHPGYLGMILSWVGFPLVLGSFYSLIPVAIAVFLLALRTYLEDKMLLEELVGYDAYSKRTKYRLVPYIF